MFTVLEHGWIVEGPTADNAVRGGWRVIVRRSSGDHRQEIVGVLQSVDRMFVITAYENVPIRRRPTTGEDTE